MRPSSAGRAPRTRSRSRAPRPTRLRLLASAASRRTGGVACPRLMMISPLSSIWPIIWLTRVIGTSSTPQGLSLDGRGTYRTTHATLNGTWLASGCSPLRLRPSAETTRRPRAGVSVCHGAHVRPRALVSSRGSLWPNSGPNVLDASSMMLGTSAIMTAQNVANSRRLLPVVALGRFGRRGLRNRRSGVRISPGA
jgi:hypothetical protein